MENITYEIIYSVGTTRHDESRYIVTENENGLSRRIASLQSKGKRIHEIRIK